VSGEPAGAPGRGRFTELPDLAVRTIGGSVADASDELFAERENLIKRAAPAFAPGTFGPKGQVYDGWETRRRREPGYDHAVVRLGAAGVIRGVVVDTSFFTGNYPPEISVEAAGVEGYPSPAELAGSSWATIVPRSPVKGDTRNAFEVADGHRYTHVRLSIYPDGGVARLRVHGEVVPDPRYLAGTVDLAAAENGGLVTGCSDMFYSSAANLIQPGRPATMGDGWENARRRDGGHDWVTVRLAVPGRLRHAELDTSCFVGNAPGWARLSGTPDLDTAGPGAGGPGGPGGPGAGAGPWPELLPRTRLQPDTRHRFLLGGGALAAAVRLDVYPDGGMARLRLWGEADPASLRAAAARWLDVLPATQAASVLETAGLPRQRAAEVAAAGAGRWDRLPAPVRASLAP
jgi:allantoicase